ncbi:putative ABC-type exoprotein transport system permease subunit [Bacillus mesophilus]|uniref:Uncharacterized protein n=1 Tax=Bacillus mesophilus TaxID=1808955 RepID=A0A6M0QB11_9BACI|nr:ABC transporter permease [Bacillus mesophilus]MBM7662847.1 putative ABC-type exoprotein transport system permease subunit [Bacillus mesophilus]NEY73437.1 hypothetical protein [Bacillus mesophilus]
MSAKQLFFRRLVREWKDQWHIFHSVLDWSVLLYIAIPSIVFGTLFYIDLWRNVDLYWHPDFPILLILLPVLLVSTMGNFRTYLLKADLLFLIQRKKTIHTLKILGFFYTFVLKTINSLVLVFMVTPVMLKVYYYSFEDLMNLALYLLAFSLTFLTVNKIIDHRLIKWSILFLLFVGATLGALFPNQYVSSICIVVVVVSHLTYIIKNNHWFLREIEIEEYEKTKYVRLIINFSAEVEKAPSSTFKKPILLWRKSGRIFKERSQQNGLLELILKGFLRDRGLFFTYLQLMLLTCTAIYILPFWLKWVIWILFFLFINLWTKALYTKLMSSPFFSVVPTNEGIELEVCNRFIKLLTLPPVLFTGMLSVLSTIL